MFDFLKRKKQGDETTTQVAEIPLEYEEKTEPTQILVEKIGNLGDSDSIIRKIRAGAIVIANIRELKENKPDELKQAIGRIKTAVGNMQGDIAGVGEEWVVVTPSTAVIKREGI
jgi:SepF-like predicted cell division protein (DUF552 family)